MADFAPVTALGLESGTSLHGVDAAILRTDGEVHIEPGPALTRPYAPEMRAALHAMLGREDRGGQDIEKVEAALTHAHADAVRALRNLPLTVPVPRGAARRRSAARSFARVKG